MTEGAEDEVEARARARVGSVLKDKWTLDALLGVGGMAAVYAATHRNRKRGAVKLLHQELSVDSNIRQRFLREGYVANSVDHPGAVRVDDDDIAEDGAAFLVMELLEGETVYARAIRKGGRLPVPEVLSIAEQLLDVLAAAHAKGIVHRDLKPENLFLTKAGVLKVLDFGIARLRETQNKATSTTTGSLMGTPAFMAPEQARGRWDDVDGQTDIWAVGATMFTLLTGRLVFEAETANEALGLAMMHHAPGILTVMPEVPAGVAEVVDRALAYDKSQRFPDAASMRDAVKLVSQSGASSARMPTLSIPDGLPTVSAAPGAPGVARTAQFTTNRGVTTAAGARGPGGIPIPILGAAGVIVLLGIVVAIVVLRQGTAPEPTTVASSPPPPPPETAERFVPKPGPTVTPKTPTEDDAQVLSFDQLPTALPPPKVGAGVPPATGSPSSKKPAASATPPPKDDPFAKRR